MERLFEISRVALEGHTLSFEANGIPVTCDLAKASNILAQASAEQVVRMIIDPAGVGFHWPELDEDLSVRGILRDAGIQLPAEKAKQTEKLQPV